jgi:hypothetical protein
MTLKIDLLAIDMDAGKHWGQRVTEELYAVRTKWRRARLRAKWLHEQGREAEAQKLDAEVKRLEETYDLGAV